MEEQDPLGKVYTLLTFVVSTVMLAVLGVLFYQVRWLFWTFAIFTLVCVVAVMLDFTLRRLTRSTWRDITQSGIVSQNLFGAMEIVTPQVAGSTKVTEEKPKFKLVVPTVAELLDKGMLGTADLLLGYRVDNGEPYWGVWGAINTFCVAGKSRSGKTVTLFFLIVQALLNHAIVWVIDPHGVSRQKKSALRVLLEPLSEWVRFASTDDEIAQMAEEFWECMEAKRLGHDRDLTPRLLVIDEFTGAAEDYPKLYEVVNKAAREWAGYNGFCAIAGHEWTQGGKLLVKMRRNLHARFVHRIDADYAKYLLNSKKIAPLAEKLRTGNNYFQSVEGDTEIIELRTPLGGVQDAVTVAEKLLQIAGSVDIPQLNTPEHTVQQLPPIREQIAQHHTTRSPETETFQHEIEPFLSLPAPEMKSFQTPGEKLAEIKRLRMLNFNQSQIIQNIWHVKPGKTQAYELALAEYKRLLDELVRSA